jgi:hypothetical protein
LKFGGDDEGVDALGMAALGMKLEREPTVIG